MPTSRFLSMADSPGGALWAQTDGTFWLPPPDSPTAEAMDDLFYLIFYIAAFFFVLIVSLMIYFVIRYRRRPGIEPGASPWHNTPLEIIWTVIPVAIIVVIFYRGFTAYLNMRLPPREAYEINVTARQWGWMFRYPLSGHVSNELYVPAGRPVRLIMQSRDVIHSLAIPDLRVKMDIVPGRYTKTWFQADKAGQHEIYCAEYCGTQHSTMTTSLVVLDSDDFDKWLEDAVAFTQRSMTPAQRGEMLYRRYQCVGCHTVAGTAGTGPSFKGIFGQTHSFRNARPQAVDENYIRESILDPSLKVREGFNDQMNSYINDLDDDQINDIIQFIKELK